MGEEAMTAKGLRKKLRDKIGSISWFNVIVGVVVIVVAVIVLLGAAIFIKGWFASSTDEVTSAAPSASPSATTTTDPSQDPNVDGQDQTNDDSNADKQDQQVLYDWAYPQQFLDMVKDAGYDTQVVNNETVPVLVPGSILTTTDYSDAIQPPLASNDMDGVLVPLLRYPDSNAAAAFVLAHNPTILENSPFLADFPNDPSGINDWAEAALDNVDSNTQYFKAMNLVAMTVQNYQVLGVGVRTTTFSLHVHVGGPNEVPFIDQFNPYAIPEFEMADTYTGTFVIFGAKAKGSTGCVTELFGVNVTDGRFVLLPDNCAPTPPPPPTVRHNCPANLPFGEWPNCKDSPAAGPTGTPGNGMNQDTGPGTTNTGIPQTQTTTGPVSEGGDTKSSGDPGGQ